MKTMIENYCKENGIRAISVCIHDHGKNVFTYANGPKTKSAKTKVDSHTRFTIGSISKLFVTVAILQLCQQRKIDLDKPVCTYLGDFRMTDKRYLDITVRMLLNHSSGLSSTTFRGKYTNHFYPQYIQDMLAYYKQEPLKSKPGKYSVYCNDGFVLAQYLVEIISQLSFREYVHLYITQPLGMNDTECPGAILKQDSYAQAPNDYECDFKQEFVNGIGSGGIYSTAHDLCLFLDGLTNNQLLTTTSFKEMSKSQMCSHVHSLELNASGYGLGFDHVELPYFKALGYQALAKSGATFGYSSYTYMIPEKNITVAVLCTSNDVGVTMLAKQLGKHYLQAKQPFTPLLVPKQAIAIEGIYGANNRVYQVEVAKDELKLAYYQGNQLSIPVTLSLINHEYHYQGQLFGFEHPHFGFIEENNEVYMYVTYLDEQVEIRSLIGQKIKIGTNKQMAIEGQCYLKLNEYLAQRTFYTQDLQVLRPICLPAYDCVLAPFPLQVIDDYHAISFIEMPGNYAREMCSLTLLEDGTLKLGPYRYIDIQKIEPLKTSFDLVNDDTKWFHYSLAVDIDIPNNVRVVGIKMIDTQALVKYDSLYHHQLPTDIDYIGFMGKAGTHIDVK